MGLGSDEFERIEKAVRVLSGSPLIAPALISRRDEDIANANSALDRYNSNLGSSVSYHLDTNGMAIASSNRNDPDSFVGISYESCSHVRKSGSMILLACGSHAHKAKHF